MNTNHFCAVIHLILIIAKNWNEKIGILVENPLYFCLPRYLAKKIGKCVAFPTYFCLPRYLAKKIEFPACVNQQSHDL